MSKVKLKVFLGILIFFVPHLWAYSLLEEARVVARPDYVLGVVFLERWRGDIYLGVERVIPLDEYLDYSIKEAVIGTWQSEARQTMARREMAAEPSGLIPDIELPKLPFLGEGSKIDITGSDRITLGGSQTVVTGVTQTVNQPSLFPELKMEQQLAVSVNGTIGERTKITIDHNSEREEQQNKIRLQYTGTEDDVVRSIELGDTKLDIPGTSYTGDLPARQGLFGISAKGKMGPVDLYAVASREGSQSQSQSFTGKRRVKTDTIWDVEYVARRFYKLPGVDTNERLVGLRIYIDDRNSGNNQAAVKAIATVFPHNPDSVVEDSSSWWSYDRTGGDFDLKSPGIDYVVQPGNIIEFLNPIERNYIIGAVIYKATDTIGGQLVRDSLVLCLLKPEVTDSLSRAWDLELRNSYQLPETDVKLDAIQIFRYDPQGQHSDYETDPANPYFGTKFLQILRLDPDGDGRLQYPEFDSKTGIIRFPGLKPFAAAELSVKDSIIYRVNADILPPGTGRKYFLVVSYYSVTETYYLGQTDIMENSEKIYVNGQLKTRNVDYSIDYKTGILTFLTPLPPDADIKVTFEYQPWFTLTQSSLVGTRAEWMFAPQGKIGSSFFFRDEGIREDKPILGSEPFQRTIAETDIGYSVTSDAVTAFLDRLPVIWAQAPTRFDFRTEGAVSLPNPNTRGVAYLDDFEGTTIIRDVPNTALLWSFASVPVGKDTAQFARSPLKWFNPAKKVRKDSVFGSNIGDEASETQDILRVVFSPDNSASWAGIMQAPPGAQIGMNFTDIENLEVILRSQRGRGNLHISVGMAIDEDAPRRAKDGSIKGLNGRLDTEDRNGNGILDQDEDTGLDGVFGADSLWGPGSLDDGNDDYDPYNNQQGTENNRRLDAEDLDRNGFSRYNHYFEYTIALQDEKFLTPLYNNWRLYRLPLRDSTLFSKIGTPKWEDIRVVRVWFDGFETPDTLELYSIQFVGSKWRDPRITDKMDKRIVLTDTTEKVWVGQVSKKTDTSYNSPFELKRDITGRLETEAALLFGYSNLDTNHQAFVSKTITTGEDYRDYEDLRWFVHDDGNGLNTFIRLGSDSANYYEFRAPISSGRRVLYGDGRWFEFSLKLESLPLLKLKRDSLQITPESIWGWKTGEYYYRIKGTPVLANIRWTALGLENTGRNKVSGNVWFNDLRLTTPRKEPGYGFTAQTNFQLADFAGIDLRYSYSDPNFRRFSDGRGVKTGGFEQNFGTNIRMNFDRLLPRSWKLSIPFGYSIARQVSVPKFSPTYPDLRLELREGSQVTGRGLAQEINLTNISKGKSSNKLLNYTIEAMTFSWYERWAANRRYPFYDSSSSTGWQWRYDINPDVKISLGKDRELYPLPRDIRLAINRGKQIVIRGDTIRSYPDTLRGNGLTGDFNIGFSPIEDLNIEYGWESERDLIVSNPDTIFGRMLGAEGSRQEDFNVSYELEIGEFFNPSIEFNGEYSHERPKMGTTYASYRNINNSGEISLSATLELPDILDKFATAERTRRATAQRVPRKAGKPASKPEPDEDEELRDTTKAELEGDTATTGSAAKKTTRHFDLKPIAGELAKSIEPLEVSYTISRSSDYQVFSGAAPWYYRFGFTDTFPIDTSIMGRLRRTKDLDNNFRLSTGGGYRDFSLRLDYNLSWGKNAALVGATADRSIVWPNIQMSINRVHNLFSAFATDSRISSNYRKSRDVRGELLPLSQGGETLAIFGRTETRTNDFNPLFSWQTSWKKRISTTFNINYNTVSNISYLSETGLNRSQTDSRTQGANFSISYAFSAPQGLKVPFLKRVRFTSDLNLTGQLRFSQTVRDQKVWSSGAEPTVVPQQRDNAFGTTIGASYRFSRAIEAGLNSGYSYNRGLSGITTKRTDLNCWVLFRF
ncbi:MAG: hypothetical protein WHU95_02170 [candidate division WOR-3 bacterium]|jgi:hypothetical protein|nr:hypothetical protein [candidate division WOR-3 bacterium]MDH7518492.1 hypothetical protein [bacterium]